MIWSKQNCNAIISTYNLLSRFDVAYTVKSPLRVRCNKGIRTRQKYLILNKNAERNACGFTYNFAKKEYKDVIRPQIEQLPVFGKVIVIYTVHQATRRKYDKGNICSIHEKFFMDALVESGKLKDDDSSHDLCSIYLAGEVLKSDPHVEICICPLD
jgi:hypothetical protein